MLVICTLLLYHNTILSFVHIAKRLGKQNFRQASMIDKNNNELDKFNGLPIINNLESLVAKAKQEPNSEVASGEQNVSSASIENLRQAIEKSKEKLLDKYATEWSGEISQEEIEALLERMPYLQLCNGDAEVEFEYEIAFVRSKSGWLVHDYWHALSTSPGEHLYNTDMIDEDAEGGTGRSGIGMPPGVGTIVKQGFDTAEQMIKLAKMRGWKGVYIVDGHRRMKWAAWVAAQLAGLNVYNFEPSEKERDRLARLRRNEAVIDRLRVDLRSRVGMSR